MSNSKVMIGCPVRNRAWILPRYLERLEALDYNGIEREYCFILNDSNDKSGEILFEFAHKTTAPVQLIHKNLGQKYGSQREEYSFSNLALLRNLFIDNFLRSTCSHLLSLDSDILIPPNALQDLLESNKDIISLLLSNGEILGDPNIFNILRKEGDRFVHIKDFPYNRIIDVDCTGAAYLIKRRVLEQGVRYSSKYGAEDIGFCLSAKRMGFQISCNTGILADHIMKEKNNFT